MPESRSLGTRHAVVIGLVCLGSYLLGLFILPNGSFLLASGFTVITGAALLVSRARSTDTETGAQSSLLVPSWLTFSILSAGVVFGLLTATGQLTRSVAGYGLVLSVSMGYLSSLAMARRLPTQDATHHRVSVWMVSGMLVIAGLFGIGVAVLSLTPVGLVLVGGMFIVTFYIGFILPVGLIEIIRSSDNQQPVEPYPDVSVIIPAYNEEGYLSNCIESILQTEYPDEHREIIVVDDGSSDGTYEEAAQYRECGVEVYSRPNGGRDSALNLGIYCSSGDIIVPLDADSLLKPDALNILAGTLQQNPELGAVAGDIRVGNKNSILTKIQAIEYVFSINIFRRACSYFNAVPIVPGCIGGFRREALDEVDGFDPDTVTEDFDITVQILDAGWSVQQVNALATTEAPFTLKDLYAQRVRWYSGGLQTVLKHLDLYTGSDSRFLHRFSFPFLSLSYVFRPIVGTVATVLILVGLFTSGGLLVVLGTAYFMIVIGIATFLVLFMLDEEYRLFPWYVFLLVGYKHFIDIVFLRSIVGIVFDKDVEWGELNRELQVKEQQ